MARAESTHQIRLPQALACSKELVARRAAHDEVLGEINATNAVEAADEGLAGGVVDAGNDGADKVRAEAALVEGRRDEVGHGLGRDLALLAQAVHVDFVAEEVGDGRHVRGQPRQAQVHGAVVEDLGEVVGHGQGLHAQPQVAGDGHAVFAHHRDTGAAVWWRMVVRRKVRAYGVCETYLC